MKKTLETKLMIIENFIDHFTSNEIERERMKKTASLYVEQDHVDEIETSFEQYKLESIKWGVEDFIEIAKEENIHLSRKEAQILLEKMIRQHDATIGITWETVKYYVREFSENN